MPRGASAAVPVPHGTVGHQKCSDNSANNRLYEFLGRDHINQRIWDLGYPNTRIRHRLSIQLNDELNRYTNPFVFYDNGKKVYQQPSQLAKLDLNVNYNDYLIAVSYTHLTLPTKA